MKLTQATVSRIKIPAGKNELIVWDAELHGFGLRVRKGGSKTWVCQYKIGAKNRRIVLGSTAMITADQARNGWDGPDGKHLGASIILANAKHGIDAANERHKNRAKASTTFGKAIADFLAYQQPRVAPAYYEATERYLNQHWKPLQGLAVDSITREVVAAQLSDIAKTRGAVSADRARSALSKFFTWAIGNGRANQNPVAGTLKAVADDDAQHGPRDRVLTDPELAAVWLKAPESDYGRILKLLILTACRRDEIGALRWSEVDLGADVLRLPGERTKNGRPHDVPLSADAAAILSAIPRREGRALVFGQGDRGYSGWSKAKLALDEKLDELVTPWRLHDLRRTAATRMADCGVLPHVVEAAINHVSGHKAGVAGIYNRATYAAEKKQAFEALAGYVSAAVARADGANVVAFKKRPS